LRILHVNHTLDLGGTEIMLLDLASGQKRLGHTVTICSMYGPGLLDGKAAEYGIPVVHLNSPNKLTTKVRNLAAYLREHPQDIVHSHWGVWLPTALAGFLRRTPRVHTHHANQRRRLFLEHRAASVFTTKVVVLTPEVDDYIRKWVSVPKRKIAVIPNGIDLSRFAEVPETALEGIPSGATVVGMVARLSPPKDYSTFMRAAKLVLLRFPDVQFVAVGDGPQRAQFEAERAQLELGNFHFLGNRLDVLSVFKRMTINVLATKNEGLSITLLEAMASGCACIASDIPANRFALDGGNAGLLVPGLNPEAMAAAIERLLVDSELRDKFHQRAMERSKYFTAERMAKDYINLYGELTR
jgi:glycosyltransferase involved in cell wall biosynthesis